jgi:arsenate reductase (glutaredoxin)
VTITIYHNPACGTSRNVLALIRNSGEEPRVIEYLKTPPTRDELAELIRRMGLRPRDLLRRKGTPYDALGLDDPKFSDDALIDLMIEHPILINRSNSRSLERTAHLSAPDQVDLGDLGRADRLEPAPATSGRGNSGNDALGSISRTVSDGRHSLTPSGVTTIGRKERHPERQLASIINWAALANRDGAPTPTIR